MAEDDDLFWEEVKDVKPLKIKSKLIDTQIVKTKNSLLSIYGNF